jgi:hypothetical protein
MTQREDRPKARGTTTLTLAQEELLDWLEGSHSKDITRLNTIDCSDAG